MKPRLLKPQLGALPLQLGATTTRGLYATRNRSHPLSRSAKAQFVSWRNPPTGKFTNRYAESREISPSTGNILLGSEQPTAIESSSGGRATPTARPRQQEDYTLPTGLTSCHGVHTHSFVSWRNPPAGKLSNQYAENRAISPSDGNLLLDNELPTGIQSSNGGAQLVELALLYKLCPATAGLKAGIKKQRQSKCMQFLNYSKNHVGYFNL